MLMLPFLSSGRLKIKFDLFLKKIFFLYLFEGERVSEYESAHARVQARKAGEEGQRERKTQTPH